MPPLRSTTRSNHILSLLVERRRSTRTAPTVSATKISGSRWATIQPRCFAAAPSCRSRRAPPSKQPPASGAATGTPLAEAAETYFKNLENRGVDAESIRCYRSGVDPFVKHCKRATVEEVKKQDTLDFMGWRPTSRYRVSRPSARRSSQTSQHPVSGQLPVRRLSWHDR